MGEIIKRHGGYSIRWYEGGRRRVLASKQTSYAEAKRMLLEIEARVARGEVGIGERRGQSLTVAELIERYLTEYSRPRLKDVDRYRAQARSVLQKALPHVGKLSAEQIQQSDVVRMRDAIARKFASGTVRNVLSFLGAAFSWAVRAGLAPANPCRGVERPTVTHSLDFLTKEEVRVLLDSAAARATTPSGHMLHIAVAIAIYTGLRKGELFGLRWIDLDVETRRLTVARSYRTTPKSGKARHLRLPSVLLPLLKSWREHCPQSPEGAVLPLGSGASKVGGKEAMLGLPRLMAEIGLRPALHPFHLLRHTYSSHYVMQGGNILALQRILGHARPEMTMIYAHLAPDFLGEEMDRVKF